MNVLVIAPHPDDECIGPGGSLLLHSQAGDRVVAAFLTSGEAGLSHPTTEQACAIRENESAASASILGLAKTVFFHLPDGSVKDHLAKGAAALRTLLAVERPGTIYIPHEQEDHPDHAVVRELLSLARESCDLPEPWILGYEVWTPMQRFDHVQDISRVLPEKLRAIREHRSQTATFNYEQAAEGLAMYRGGLGAKTRYAEVFVTLW